MCTAPVAVRTQHIQTGNGQYGWRTISNWQSGAEKLEMGSGLYSKSKGTPSQFFKLSDMATI